MPFDQKAHLAAFSQLVAKRDALQAELYAAVGKVKLTSSKELSTWLENMLGGPDSLAAKRWPRTKTRQLCTGEDDLKAGLYLLPPEAQHVVKDLLIPYKEAVTQVNCYGENLAQAVHPVTGRLHSHYHLTGAVSGRMSSSNPNMQSIPKDRDFRALFRASEGRRMLIADYSQIELRVAAHVAGEDRLLQAYREGRDVHSMTAAQILGKPLEEVTKDDRQTAKAVNFGLLFGQRAQGLQAYAANKYGVTLTLAEAEQHRQTWFAAYRKIGEWHRRLGAEARRKLSVRTQMGRERRWERGDFRVTQAYNHPIQGSAAEVLRAALGHLYERLTEARLDAKIIAVVHDEVVIEASEADTEKAKVILEQAMNQGMLDVFPEASTNGLVEAKIGQSWADK